MISKKTLIFPVMLVLIFLEFTFISFPFVLLILLLSYILYPSVRFIILACIIGIIVDSISLSTIGKTPLFLVASFLLIDVYKKAFEIKDSRVLAGILFVLTFVYSRLFSYSDSLFMFVLIFGIAAFAIRYVAKNQVL